MKFLFGIFLAVLFSTEIYANTVNNSSEESAEKPKATIYTTKYDDVNIDEILHSDRLLLNYVNCLMDRAHCSPDGLELKQNLPDAINNNCNKCSEKQRIGSDQVMHYLIDNKPEWWNELESKYNSDGSYKMTYLNEKNQQNDCEKSTEKD